MKYHICEDVTTRLKGREILVIKGKNGKQYRLKKEVMNMWKGIMEGITEKEIVEETGISHELLSDYLKEFEKHNLIKKGEGKLQVEKTVLWEIYDRKYTIHKAGLVITDECNLRCRHCYNEFEREKREKLTIEQWKDVVIQLKNLGCYNIMITGGEALLYKNIFDLLDFIDRSGFTFTINSNGILIDEKIVSKLKKYTNLDSVCITLYGLSKETYADFCRREIDPQKVINNIKLLNENGIDTIIQFNYNNNTFEDALELKQFEKKYNLQLNKSISYIYSNLTASKSEDFNLSDEQLKRLYDEKIIEINDKCNPCTSCGRERCSISSRGDVSICELMGAHPIGNITKNSLMEIWSSLECERFLENNNPNQECDSCDVKDFCVRCDGVSLIECGDRKGISKRLCDYTRKLKKVKESGVIKR
ncbi:radical SAM protein [Oceanirhabdus sp. W0125-5]|uniref:radical SAM protein n=1 Tax=Oceanirhabdus sp. W0125-5 TaxID=2999116 RepID=UPI0022F3334C|nr:radical SAM protein [Oceanirhabdus sp. W0125-5]WBW96421.1 radical SAM protein [Oceanirhabdus sp. W0125-5]